MGRLKIAPPTVAKLPTTIAYLPVDKPERDKFRGQQHWRKWYRTVRWKRLRWATLLRDKFTCQRCGHLEGNTSKLVADHVTPHRGNERMFWEGDLQTLCSTCHSSDKQREEHRGV